MGFPPSIETFVLMHDPYYRILSGSKKGGSGSVCSSTLKGGSNAQLFSLRGV